MSKYIVYSGKLREKGIFVTGFYPLHNELPNGHIPRLSVGLVMGQERFFKGNDQPVGFIFPSAGGLLIFSVAEKFINIGVLLFFEKKDKYTRTRSIIVLEAYAVDMP